MTLRSEIQLEFPKAALIYVNESNWTYYIGGSNYHSTDNTDITGLRYCASEFSIADPGNLFKYCLILNNMFYQMLYLLAGLF